MAGPKGLSQEGLLRNSDVWKLGQHQTVAIGHYSYVFFRSLMTPTYYPPARLYSGVLREVRCFVYHCTQCVFIS